MHKNYLCFLWLQNLRAGVGGALGVVDGVWGGGGGGVLAAEGCDQYHGADDDGGGDEHS